MGKLHFDVKINTVLQKNEAPKYDCPIPHPAEPEKRISYERSKLLQIFIRRVMYIQTKS